MGDVPQLRPLTAPAPGTGGPGGGESSPLAGRRGGKSFGQNPLVVAALDKLNRLLPWQRLPPLLGAVWLAGYREVQRAKNLYDTSAIPSRDPAQPAPPDPRVLQYRTSEGSYNDLSDPQMGMAGTRFGRNFPLHAVYPEPLPALLEPSPRAVSRQLMTREAFQPATTLNLLAAAWIQFQTHDWFNHGEPLKDDQFAIPLEPGDPWPENPMRVGRTAPDPTRVPGAHDGPPTYVNPASHWWDGSNVYGSTAAVTQRLRTMEDGKLIVKNRRLPIDPETGIAITGFNDNWWVGLGLLHTLFALEHNAICDRLRSESPSWSDDQLFETARLINGALMAKIHTVEWTPGILAHPTLRLGMRANWWGLAEERLYRLFGRLSGSDVVSGIPGSVARPPQRPLLPDRGVRRGLPPAPPDPGRARLPLPGHRGPLEDHDLPRDGLQERRERDRRAGLRAGRAVLLRHRPPGGHHPAQLPPLPARPPDAGRPAPGPGGGGRPARQGAGRPPLQRVPAPAAPPPGRTRSRP